MQDRAAEPLGQSRRTDELTAEMEENQGQAQEAA